MLHFVLSKAIQTCNDNKYILHSREIFLTGILSDFFISGDLQQKVQSSYDVWQKKDGAKMFDKESDQQDL